jgi:transcriptional regulatory protein RtcR
MAKKKTVVLGMLGTTLDAGGKGPARWSKWRPTVAMCQQEDFVVDRLELIHPRRVASLAQTVLADIRHVSPETEVRLHTMDLADPWDLGEVYGALFDFARAYQFEPEKADYLVHITTGTHIAQICMFLLTESRHFPARLLQTSPAGRDGAGPGSVAIIDLDLSKYDQLASRFHQVKSEGLSFLKSGIETRNADYNRLIERIEQVAIRSRDPLLLCGPTGSGKSRLARRIYQLKRAKRQVLGDLVEFNCATLRGDGAMSTLFGHTKGAFTGAVESRPGLLRKADKGILFLDEVGELGLDEQAMLLRAIEEKTFYPVGADREVRSDFQLLAGTNRDLAADVGAARFREDLFARINLWTFLLPGLRDRHEDLEPNLEYELELCGRSLGKHVTFSREARERFLAFAASPAATWPGNFRDFGAAIRRMATLAEGARISPAGVDDEIERLRHGWQRGSSSDASAEGDALIAVLGVDRARSLDRFDRAQLADVLSVCRSAKSLSDAGRQLYAESRRNKTSTNDADRLRKYLARFGLSWREIQPD